MVAIRRGSVSTIEWLLAHGPYKCRLVAAIVLHAMAANRATPVITTALIAFLWGCGPDGGVRQTGRREPLADLFTRVQRIVGRGPVECGRYVLSSRAQQS